MKEEISNIKIDNDVPVPNGYGQYGKYVNKYKLKTGQSIFLAGEKNGYNNGLLVRLKKENPEHTYISRAWVEESGRAGARIWRTK